MADIVVLGSVPSGKAILRSGAKLGDLIYVTGNLGSSHDALTQLRDGKHLRPQSHLKHFYPEPRLAIGQFLREKKLASAMIDISDGLSTDLAHICEESKVGAVLYADALANVESARSKQRFVSQHDPAASSALHGGDEYELVFTAARDRRIPGHIAGVPITRIGEIVRGNDMKLVVNGKSRLLKPRGWEHFR